MTIFKQKHLRFSRRQFRFNGSRARRRALWDSVTGRQKTISIKGVDDGLASLVVMNNPPRLLVGYHNTKTLDHRMAVFAIERVSGDAGPAMQPDPALAAIGHAPERLPIPDDQKLKTSIAELRQLLQIDAKEVEAAVAKQLAAKLLEISREEQDAVVRYALLAETARLATHSADSSLVKQAVSAITNRYQVDRLSFAGRVLQSAIKRPISRREKLAWSQWAHALGDQALEAERIAQADGFYDMAFTWAVRSSDPSDAAMIKRKREQVRGYKDEYTVAQPFQEKLASDPDDAAASYGWGYYLCFVRGKWAEGIGLLAQGDNKELKQLAIMERSSSGEADDDQKIAAQWLLIAKATADERVKNGATESARYWLGKAKTKLSGLAQLKVGKQLEDLPTTIAPERTD